MNYFEFYGGDYARDTAHLSLMEHGAFLLLLSAYYSTEKPLPGGFHSLYRIARAMTEDEQAAVRMVADEFFPVDADGLRHNERADAEILKAQARIEAARNNGRKGGRPPSKKPKSNPSETQRVSGSEPNNKAHHTPHAISPSDTTARTETSEVPRGTDAGRACAAMKAAGLIDINPSHPRLLDALREGVTVQALADTAREAAGKSPPKGFAWAISTARGRHAERVPAINGGTHATSRRPSAQERIEANVRRGQAADDDWIEAEAVRLTR